jgi:hypothetical protein
MQGQNRWSPFLDKIKRGVKMKICKEVERRRKILEQAKRLKENGEKVRRI